MQNKGKVCIYLPLSYVYPTYILRISYVIDRIRTVGEIESVRVWVYHCPQFDQFCADIAQDVCNGMFERGLLLVGLQFASDSLNACDFQFVAYVFDTGDEGDFLRGVIAVSMSVLAG